ncbi:hypothetical protein [Rhizobium herbae]|uniref:Uncharacterized protein n=1 Tax=Rhizobium herbae TaxID=508661 RepID=A0ABS4EUD7_9HYPH|nr:hypothetical protein [Rhizobium herbae]MBP1861563.1 hypothetical protein [Rhizobium herbae]
MIFFSGIRATADAFSSQSRSKDPQVNDAAQFLIELGHGSGLGFFGRKATPDAVTTAIGLLREHGRKLTHEQTVEVVGLLQKLDETRAIRRRFVVQVLVTAATLAVALSVVFNIVDASDDLKKVGYGLLGTIIGYWLK